MKSYLGFVLLFIFFTVNSSAQEIEIKNNGLGDVAYAVEVKGRVPSSAKCVEVSVRNGTSHRVEHDGLFLGVTAIIDGEEKNYYGGIVSGRFNKPFTINFNTGEMREDIKWVACLYRGKMLKDNCAMRNNGNPCKYCREMGYHLDERVARAVLE